MAVDNDKSTNKEFVMFQVSEKAVEVIKEYLKDAQDPQSIRIMMSEGGWAGPSLGMALDEPKDNDEVFNEGGLTFLVNKDLLGSVQPITVEFVETEKGSGFAVKSALTDKGKADNCCGTCSC